MAYDIQKHLSSKHCTTCHGEGDGFKCPKCGYTTVHYDPLHFNQCKEKSMVQVKCKKCGEAESNCKCV
jgi:predicted RNA-binding Zn-ribbon protein involved in translation (DUF1610 family)